MTLLEIQLYSTNKKKEYPKWKEIRTLSLQPPFIKVFVREIIHLERSISQGGTA
jgi:hypothetical protein|nr:MAG TPA: hypothetical protein [Caudoviricetes sp.]